MREQLDNHQDELVSVSQATKFLGVSMTTLYRYEKRGLIHPYRTVGGHRRYNLFELVKFRDNVMTSELSKPGRRRTVNE
jgi:predicted site-specific integrase-resolvase